MLRNVHYLFIFILLLAACSSEPKELAVEPSGFMFSVDPQNQTVTVEAVGGASLSAQQTDEPRVLIPGTELSLNYTYSFAPGNILRIGALVRNETSNLVFEQPFSFSVAPRTSNIVGSTEPTVTANELGIDNALTPGEVSGDAANKRSGPDYFSFEVEHKNEPFSYFVNASAVVKEITVSCNDSDTVVNLQSETLEDAIRSSLGLNVESLTCADMVDLRVLEAPGVLSLQGLQFATNLEELYIPGQHLSYAPITNLTKLTHLDISGGRLDFFSSGLNLSKLANLMYLDMNGFSSIGGYSIFGSIGLFSIDLGNVWPKLTHLNISRVTGDLPNVSGLTELVRLEASNLDGEAFSPAGINLNSLVNLTKLSYLDLDQSDSAEFGVGVRVTGDLNALAKLTHLSYLDVSGMSQNLASLVNLNNLTYLGLRRNNYYDVSALLANTGLADAEEEIDLTLNCLYSSEALEDIQTLEARNPNVQNVFYEPQADFCN